LTGTNDALPSAGDVAARDIVDVDLGNGLIVKAEVWLAPEKPVEGAGRSDASWDFWRKGRKAALDTAAPTINAMAQWVHSQMAQIGAMAPDRVGVEIGVKFVVQTPGLVAPVLGQVGAESTLLVRLEWDTRITPGKGEPTSATA
jgi:NAD-dependent oxidoreductase involved in siderophore biosynthesis